MERANADAQVSASCDFTASEYEMEEWLLMFVPAVVPEFIRNLQMHATQTLMTWK